MKKTFWALGIALAVIGCSPAQAQFYGPDSVFYESNYWESERGWGDLSPEERAHRYDAVKCEREGEHLVCRRGDGVETLRTEASPPRNYFPETKAQQDAVCSASEACRRWEELKREEAQAAARRAGK